MPQMGTLNVSCTSLQCAFYALTDNNKDNMLRYALRDTVMSLHLILFEFFSSHSFCYTLFFLRALTILLKFVNSCASFTPCKCAPYKLLDHSIRRLFCISVYFVPQSNTRVHLHSHIQFSYACRVHGRKANFFYFLSSFAVF